MKEYKVIYVGKFEYEEEEGSNLETLLNELAADGWTICAVIGHTGWFQGIILEREAEGCQLNT